ncbi:tensin-1-like isoform X2 [Trichogramma pretiosum]|uniref:tensin-1-like isoform X2 n=1 Tax=Trichogramma pretiosum TaxID=7493 RepID=UPI0006C97D43|nr:tensin-1-like isoform X2 [Trichogramma pretiosum]
MADKPSKRIINAQYMGSFPVAGFDTAFCADNLRGKLNLLRSDANGSPESEDQPTPVLLIVSLAGIKVCSPDGKCVQMAHALRRISYATCEPRNGQFSFLAREPRAHFSIQYCHSFITESPEQAEELNAIVGNAFRMAYVAQLQRHQPSSGATSTTAKIIQDVINSQKTSNNSKNTHTHHRQQRDTSPSQHSANAWDCKSLSNSDTANNNHPINCKWETSNDKQQQLHNHHHHHHHHHSNSASSGSVSSDECSSSSATNSSTSAEMNLQLGSSASPTLRLSSVKTPNSIPGLRPAHDFGPVLTQLSQNGVGCSSGVGGVGGVGSSSSSSSSNNNNNNNINHHEDNLGKSSQQSTPSSEESNSPTELNSYKRLGDKPPLIKRLAMGFTGRDVLGLNSEEDSCPLVVSGGSTPNSPTTQRPQSGGYINEAIIDSENLRLQAGGVGHYGKIPPGVDPKSLTFENARTLDADYKKRPSASAGGLGIFMTPSPPPLPERYDSLNARAEENELKKAPWFQAGIPREITLEVLSQEPEGAFMVRESTSKPGCYALSLRVPRDFQPSGIAHYLIMRTQKGYKIKGFTKEFTTLTSLITHHSVMPELLPCPLSLSRYNPSYAKSKDTFNDDDEIDSDPDYTTLADFRKMMADLNV